MTYSNDQSNKALPIGGFLYFIALYMFIEIILNAVALFIDLIGVSYLYANNENYLDRINSNKISYFLLNFSSKIIYFLFHFLLIYLFLKKKKIFIKWKIILISFTLLSIIFFHEFKKLYFLDISIGIGYILYLLLSTRVKATFVN